MSSAKPTTSTTMENNKPSEPEKKKRGRKRKAEAVSNQSSSVLSQPPKKKWKPHSYGNVDHPKETVSLASTAFITDHQLSNDVSFKVIHSNLDQYPTKTDKPCNQCDHPFEGIPVLLPLNYDFRLDKYEFHPKNQFCSFPCACRFIQENFKTHPGMYIIWLHKLAREHFGLTKPIQAVGPKQLLKHMGGDLDYKEYRNMTHLQLIHSVPCVSQIMVVEKHNCAEGNQNKEFETQVFSVENIQKRSQVFSDAQSNFKNNQSIMVPASISQSASQPVSYSTIPSSSPNTSHENSQNTIINPNVLPPTVVSSSLQDSQNKNVPIQPPQETPAETPNSVPQKTIKNFLKKKK